MIFELARGRKLLVNNEDNRVFNYVSELYRSDIAALCKVNVFETSIRALEAPQFSGKYL